MFTYSYTIYNKKQKILHITIQTQTNRALYV